MTREQARAEINSRPPAFLKQAEKRGYICPVCNQGSKNGVGISKDKTGHYKCFDCGLYADTLELYGKAFNLPDYSEQLQGAADYYGIRIDGERRQERRSGKREAPADFSTLYREAAAHLTETDYPQRRGLSLEVCQAYNVGFLPAWRHPKAPETAPESPRLIVPLSAGTYLARDTREQLTQEQAGYKKQLCKGSAGGSWTFNRETLTTAARPVYVVEGAIDALSILEVGGEAVALSSTAYIKGFVEELKELKPAQPLIIALDNDGAGAAAAEKLEADLAALQIPFYRYNPAGEYKDANERLQDDREGLTVAVKEGEAAADRQAAADREARRAEYLKNSAAAHLQDFINGITASVNTPKICTGFKALDAATDGGLYEGLYIVGAISSLGKTTFLLQMADQVAQQGHDILYFSLEMARAELMAKSISRHTAQETIESGGAMKDAKTARGITDGARYQHYSSTERALIRQAMELYNRYADHVFITEGLGDVGVREIRETIQQHITFTGRVPVVFVDYLQILAPYNDRSSDKQNIDRAVLELKRISRDYKTPVIAVSSFNRDNYTAAATMAAFKESGGIEYGADVLIGLQLAGAGKAGFDATREKAKSPREVELALLKNRNGKAGDVLPFKYYAMFNLFREG